MDSIPMVHVVVLSRVSFILTKLGANCSGKMSPIQITGRRQSDQHDPTRFTTQECMNLIPTPRDNFRQFSTSGMQKETPKRKRDDDIRFTSQTSFPWQRVTDLNLKPKFRFLRVTPNIERLETFRKPPLRSRNSHSTKPNKSVQDHVSARRRGREVQARRETVSRSPGTGLAYHNRQFRMQGTGSDAEPHLGLSRRWNPLHFGLLLDLLSKWKDSVPAPRLADQANPARLRQVLSSWLPRTVNCTADRFCTHIRLEIDFILTWFLLFEVMS